MMSYDDGCCIMKDVKDEKKVLVFGFIALHNWLDIDYRQNCVDIKQFYIYLHTAIL